MFSQDLVQKMVDGVVVFATDLLMPMMVAFFLGAIVLRVLTWYTVKREYWFSHEFSKRVRKFMDLRDDQTEQSFYIIAKRLLEITYYELFEVRAIMKRRNPDAIMTVADRIFLVQQGAARIVTDTLKQLKYLKHNQERPKFIDISNNVHANNPCFNRVFGIIPVNVSNDFLNTVPGLFIVGGIFGTFLGIMKALPELGGMNLSDVEGSKLIMDNFLLKISFSMSTSIVGIIFSVGMGLANTFFSSEKVYMNAVETFERELDLLWNISSSNKMPAEVQNFEAERDPIEVLAEDLISKELNVEVGFVNLARPISKWWGRFGSKPETAKAVTKVNDDQKAA
ncbi:MAG: hypothetical protein LW878_00775 [Proteobacteria bacterium]|jgi:hypothetical protein|nr:hypothetical protein [Pseudomonadota bacterium]